MPVVRRVVSRARRVFRGRPTACARWRAPQLLQGLPPSRGELSVRFVACLGWYQSTSVTTQRTLSLIFSARGQQRGSFSSVPDSQWHERCSQPLSSQKKTRKYRVRTFHRRKSLFLKKCRRGPRSACVAVPVCRAAPKKFSPFSCAIMRFPTNFYTPTLRLRWRPGAKNGKESPTRDERDRRRTGARRAAVGRLQLLAGHGYADARHGTRPRSACLMHCHAISKVSQPQLLAARHAAASCEAPPPTAACAPSRSQWAFFLGFFGAWPRYRIASIAPSPKVRARPPILSP